MATDEGGDEQDWMPAPVAEESAPQEADTVALTWEKLVARAVPPWYTDAKLGIIVHWGPYAVPAWAPLTGEFSRIIEEQGWERWYARNPYAEWYENSMAIPGSPTHDHHRATWGRMARYDAFPRIFRQGLKDWDPSQLIEPLASSGARYLVFSAKGHDGFLLWPSRRRNPRKRGWQVSRDVVGEMATTARGKGMRFGIYYSGGLDWSFGGIPIKNRADLLAAMPRSKSYAAYVDAHWRELITRYKPSILWNDMGSPSAEDLLSLFSTFYDKVPEGLLNDRFGQFEERPPVSFLQRLISAITRLVSARARAQAALGLDVPAPRYADFRTAEYAKLEPDPANVWECVRGLGYSFGRNSAETPNELLSVESLVRLLVDVVAKGGNLMLGVSPGADGTLSDDQKLRLSGLGDWLKLNGEAIFGSRPWGDHEAVTDEGVEVRYTARGMTTYAILLGTPAGRTIVLPSLRLLPYAGLRIIGSIGYVAWFQEGKDVHIRLTEPLRESPAHVISITPHPRL
jgi:alpha-L-fucosidase